MQHINGLRDAHDLKREKRKRVTLYAADVRNMIELAFEICGDKYDIVSWVSPQPSGELSWSFHQAIQMCALLLCFMYTGARPGSLLKTSHWPNDFLRWKASRPETPRIRETSSSPWI